MGSGSALPVVVIVKPRADRTTSSKSLAANPPSEGSTIGCSAYPVVGASIVWEDKNGAHPWPTWTAQQQQELEQAFALACAGSSIPVAEIPKNQLMLSDTDYASETLSTADAWAYFKASVAQSLALETRVQLPWSIIGFNEEVPYNEARAGAAVRQPHDVSLERVAGGVQHRCEHLRAGSPRRRPHTRTSSCRPPG